jgi:hypothetical protein
LLQSSVDSCKPEFTIPSMVTLASLDGDGFLVSFFSNGLYSHSKVLQSSTVSFLSPSPSWLTSSYPTPLAPPK